MNLSEFKEKHKKSIALVNNLEGLFSDLKGVMVSGLGYLERHEEILQQLEREDRRLLNVKGQIENLEQESSNARKGLRKERDKLNKFKGELSKKMEEEDKRFQAKKAEYLELEKNEKEAHRKRIKAMRDKESKLKTGIEKKMEEKETLEAEIKRLKSSIGSL